MVNHPSSRLDGMHHELNIYTAEATTTKSFARMKMDEKGLALRAHTMTVGTDVCTPKREYER